jgi:hypothetical protein
MVWINFDWLKYESEQFQESLNHRIRDAYLAAHSVLEKAYGETKEKLYGELNKATDEESHELTSQVIDYEEFRWIYQTEALAAMALTLLASQMKSFLDEQKQRFNKTHPPDPKYAGTSELLKLATEYHARFNIDLERIEGFETVREVSLARNCCVHKGSIPSEDYKTQTKQRLLNNNGNISLTPEQLDSIIGELSQFANSLTGLLSAVRKK